LERSKTAKTHKTFNMVAKSKARVHSLHAKHAHAKSRVKSHAKQAKSHKSHTKSTKTKHAKSHTKPAKKKRALSPACKAYGEIQKRAKASGKFADSDFYNGLAAMKGTKAYKHIAHEFAMWKQKHM
jgi:hypothetical protein